jgi:hypothetical protein
MAVPTLATDIGDALLSIPLQASHVHKDRICKTLGVAVIPNFTATHTAESRLPDGEQSKQVPLFRLWTVTIKASGLGNPAVVHLRRIHPLSRLPADIRLRAIQNIA